MDHEKIDQLDLIGRYLMGQLSPEDSASFEEHFVDCRQCIARLRTTGSFLQDLRLVAAEPSPQRDIGQPRTSMWHLLRGFCRKPIVLALASLLIAVFTCTILVVHYTQRLRAEANQAMSVAEQWERRYEDERQAALSADRKHGETELKLTEQQQALELKLKDEQTERAKLATELSQWVRPEGNLPIVVLTSIRGRPSRASEAVNQITLPRSTTMFAISISLEGEMHYESYRITIFDRQHRPIWKKEGLTPNRYDSLSIGFRPGFFQPGSHSLIVEGIGKEGITGVVGNYPFQIIRKR